jgi:biotin transport system substrate-specific component
MKSLVKTQNLSAQLIVKEATYVISSVLMIAALSHVTIPLQPVPLTGQTLGVLLTGIILGRKRALAVMITYLVMGSIGFPVFANGTFGLATLIGPTGGYLLGFIPAAYAMGYVKDMNWFGKPFRSILTIIISTMLIFFFGCLWLANFMGWDLVIKAGILPFLPGAVFKGLIVWGLITMMRE